MIDREVWALRAVWLVMPFTAGRAFEEALADTRRLFQQGTSMALWLLWALMLVVLMVPRATTLTAVRIVIPAAFAATLWAVVTAEDGGTGESLLALAVAAVASMLALRAPVGDTFVDGSSYGDETRFLLGTPGALLTGPIFAVWAFIVVAAVAGPLLVLDREWVFGGIITAFGLPLAALLVPTIHRLSYRWLVFVPAGLVVHDKTALAQPQLFRVADIDALGPAPADTDLADLSLDSVGLALRVSLRSQSKIDRKTGRATSELTDIEGFVVSPNRPGAVVAHAQTRSYPVG
ncbi:MAG: hypothetical protein ACR2P0_12420 [Acidimicrobiales bacterium]